MSTPIDMSGERSQTGLKILAAYLAVSAPVAAIALAAGRMSRAVLVLHSFALIIVVMLLYRPRTGLITDWLPLASIPFLYAELPRLALTGLRDSSVQRWELSTFDTSPAQALAGRWSDPLVSELLHAAYVSYYAIIYVPPVVLYLRGRRESFYSTVAGLMTVFAFCYLIFIVFPVAGPRYLWPPPPGVFEGPVRRFVLSVLAAGSAKGTAFPSSHVAVATVQSILAFRWSARAGVALSVLTTGLALGAVYGGFHYGVDVLAGAGVGLVIGITLTFVNRDASVPARTAVHAQTT
jgi:membrane-associated phospholipid phosphatase